MGQKFVSTEEDVCAPRTNPEFYAKKTWGFSKGANVKDYALKISTLPERKNLIYIFASLKNVYKLYN